MQEYSRAVRLAVANRCPSSFTRRHADPEPRMRVDRLFRPRAAKSESAGRYPDCRWIAMATGRLEETPARRPAIAGGSSRRCWLCRDQTVALRSPAAIRAAGAAACRPLGFVRQATRSFAFAGLRLRQLGRTPRRFADPRSEAARPPDRGEPQRRPGRPGNPDAASRNAGRGSGRNSVGAAQEGPGPEICVAGRGGERNSRASHGRP